MTVKLLTEHHSEFLSVKGDYTESSESILDKVPHCWKSHVTSHMPQQVNFTVQFCPTAHYIELKIRLVLA